jgi:hypothetical protein
VKSDLGVGGRKWVRGGGFFKTIDCGSTSISMRLGLYLRVGSLMSDLRIGLFLLG